MKKHILVLLCSGFLVASLPQVVTTIQNRPKTQVEQIKTAVSELPRPLKMAGITLGTLAVLKAFEALGLVPAEAHKLFLATLLLELPKQLMAEEGKHTWKELRI